jgi:hypothetical protein
VQHGPPPTEVDTDRPPAYPRVLDELVRRFYLDVDWLASDPAAFAELPLGKQRIAT